MDKDARKNREAILDTRGQPPKTRNGAQVKSDSTTGVETDGKNEKEKEDTEGEETTGEK